MGKILAVCISKEKGTSKRDMGSAEFIFNYGLKDDAHAGPSLRQVSLLSHEIIEKFKKQSLTQGSCITKPKIEHGDFGENLVVQGIVLSSLPIGTFLHCGNVVLEITQIGKECHKHCAIFDAMGDCIMPREGIFTRVINGGVISNGDEMTVAAAEVQAGNTAQPNGAVHGAVAAVNPYRFWIIIASDRCYRAEQEDKSAPVISELAAAAGFSQAGFTLLPDDQDGIEAELKKICDKGLADLILTSGGTGFSPRDRMPEATLSVAERVVPGIAEAMRSGSMAFTKRAMLSRAVSVIRKKSLIVNLPGSPNAVRENLSLVISELQHGLDILTERDKHKEHL